jgi:hypothetical protein
MINAEELRRRMAQLSDTELLDIVGPQRRAYRAVAVELATAELARRGVSQSPAPTPVQIGLPTRRRRGAQAHAPAQASADGFVLFCEIVCAALGSVVLAAVLVAERQTQKAVLRWAATSLALPYAVWRAGRFLDRRLVAGQQTN